MTSLQILTELINIRKECREERTYRKLTLLIEEIEDSLPGKVKEQ